MNMQATCIFWVTVTAHMCVDLSPTEYKQSGMYHCCSAHQMNGYLNLNSQNSTSLDSSMKAGIQLYDYLLHWYLATWNTSSLLQDEMAVRSPVTLWTCPDTPGMLLTWSIWLAAGTISFFFQLHDVRSGYNTLTMCCLVMNTLL